MKIMTYHCKNFSISTTGERFDYRARIPVYTDPSIRNGFFANLFVNNPQFCA